MFARLVFRSLKTGEERYAVIMDDGRKGYMKFKTGICKHGRIGDEGQLVKIKDVYKFRPSIEDWEVDFVDSLKYPMVPYVGE